ncbi:MAG: hypothetical protein IB618_00015 [Candidatus Pacearchaeota archaeon]|nr:MAG: hypothetical protein IB618_00015 [Candidatus Pacearchaeota archaeon]
MGDISKTVVVILLIATILVSVIGTWFILNTIDNAMVGVSTGQMKSTGGVSVTVANPSDYMSSGAGQVGVNIENPPA